MTMMNLFNQPIGFRLTRLELFNWGTFTDQVWKITPNGQHAVLTGANGSGKSTVVDALLTLLVKNGQRNYNLASGTGNKRERSEKTYILGQYSRARGEAPTDIKSVTLRERGGHSIILGVFEDMAAGHVVTLVVILWVSNTDKVEHRYYVGHQDLNIEEHFPTRMINSHNLPKTVEVHRNNFGDYIKATRKALGLSGRDKALDLFNQTIAVKDIPSLNDFVRDHMLDKGNPEERVEGLRQQYANLTDSYEAIQRADHQIKILTPLIDAAKEYRRYDQQIEQYTLAKSLVGFYVANQACNLLQRELATNKQQQQSEGDKLHIADRELKSRRSDLQRVEIAIAQDSVGQQLREIEIQLPSLKDKINTLRGMANRYDTDANLVGFRLYSDEDSFYQNRADATTSHETLETDIAHQSETEFNLRTEQRNVIEQAKSLHEEIVSLRQRSSNIPERVASLRQQISTALSIPLDEMPFMGELLKVRQSEEKWEGTLERLLNSFAQELIVPQQHYIAVSDYVDQTHLKGRLIYRRLNPHQSEDEGDGYRVRPVGVMAYDKIEVRPETPYRDWLINRLRETYNYQCCDTTDEFRHAERAITPQGQVKHSRTRHEKDDRNILHHRASYVLGWDNRAKLHQLERELADLQQGLEKLNYQVSQTTDALKRARDQQATLHRLLNFQRFSEIDWRTPQAELERLIRQQTELKQHSGLQQLQTQQEKLQRDVKESEGRRDKIKVAIATLEIKQGELQHQLTKQEYILSSETDDDRTRWEQVKQIVMDADRGGTLSLDQISTRPSTLESSLQSSMNNFRWRQTVANGQIIDAMNNFRRDYPAEGASLTVGIPVLPAYEDIYQRLQRDDLPKHQGRFKEMLNRTVTNGITAFRASLDEQARTIDRNINELNQSLRQLDYGNGNCIQLIIEQTRDPEVRTFDDELRACIPDAGINQTGELERAYTRIQKLINRFNDDPNWTQRVIDVRRWHTFAAEQRTPDGRQVDYYSESSGKSGGQKAKLAYTILASAIAYQYGLQDRKMNDRSFHFVVIDEAFSKLDDENARYAMQLFDKLGLQLLVVTPMQQLQIIEKYVKVFHYVVNNEEGNYSQVINLTDEEYRTRRREIHTNNDHGQG